MIHVAGYKLLVRDLGDIITIHLCHGRLVSLCIQQQTGDKLATVLSRYKKHVDGNKWIQLVSSNMCPGVNAALDTRDRSSEELFSCVLMTCSVDNHFVLVLIDAVCSLTLSLEFVFGGLGQSTADEGRDDA